MEATKNKNVRFYKAAIDQVLVWIILFVVFVAIFVFVIEYAKVLRIKDNVDALTDYGARMLAVDNEDVTMDMIAAGMNNLKVNEIADIDGIQISCSTPEAGVTPENYQLTFIIKATYVSRFTNNLSQKKVVFNEASKYQRDCELTLTFNQ